MGWITIGWMRWGSVELSPLFYIVFLRYVVLAFASTMCMDCSLCEERASSLVVASVARVSLASLALPGPPWLAGIARVEFPWQSL